MLAVLACLCAVPAARATFHLMHIEQVLAGVDGDVRAQAIQLVMRLDHQGGLEPTRLVAWDAAGENPIELVDFAAGVANEEPGSRILIASRDFALYSDPRVVPDFEMGALIPEAYLAAGSLTFETDDGSIVVARVSWGGAAYTGPSSGSNFNDSNSNFGPAVPDPLPAEGRLALLFQRTSGAVHGSNATDYALTVDAAILTNNAGDAFAVVGCTDVDRDGDGVCDAADNCPDLANPTQGDLDGDGSGDLCDGCPEDPNRVEAGDCDCAPAPDADGDGVADCPGNGPQGPEDDAGASPDDAPGPAGLCGAGGVAGALLTGMSLVASRRRRELTGL